MPRRRELRMANRGASVTRVNRGPSGGEAFNARVTQGDRCALDPGAPHRDKGGHGGGRGSGGVTVSNKGANRGLGGMAWGKGRAGPGHQSRGRGREGEGTGGLSRGPGERGGGRSSSVVAAGRASSWEGTGNLGEAGAGGDMCTSPQSEQRSGLALGRSRGRAAGSPGPCRVSERSAAFLPGRLSL